MIDHPLIQGVALASFIAWAVIESHHAARRYELQALDHEANPDGEYRVVSIGAFLSANADWLDEEPAEYEKIINLQPGEEYRGGGGAAQGFVLRRVR